jgi:hypothetical protein
MPRLGAVPLLAAVACVTVVLTAGPAAADPARPTVYRSHIDAISPTPPPGVKIDIVGGDAFLQVSVPKGHTVTVQDYKGEPYLQFLDDGTVQENESSEATYLNQDRYARVTVPSGLDDTAAPRWKTIDHDGEYTWHDHRIHWMSPDRPPDIEPGDVVQTNTVPLIVDGNATTVTVSVILEHSESVLPWIGIGVVGIALALVLGWKRHTLLVAMVASVVGTVSAVIVGNGEHSTVPSGAGESPLVLIVPLVGLAATAMAIVLRWRKKTSLSGVALLAAAACMAGWALLRVQVLFKPVLPTKLPANLDRVGTTLAIAGAVAVAALVIQSGAVTPAPLTDDDAEDDD